MSARIGRKRCRPDETVRFYRPLDGNSDVSGRDAGRKTRVTRACAVVGAIVCGLAAPGIARAADPFGTAQIAAQVNAAVTQATAQATAMVPQAASGTAVTPVDSTKTLDAATKSLEVATKQAAAIASSAVAEAQRQTQSAVAASVPTAAGRAARPAAKTHRRHAARSARAAGRSPSRGPLAREVMARRESTATPLLSPSRAELPAGRAQKGVARAAGAAPTETRGPTPQRPPRLPLPPQPGGALSSGQGGGNGPLTPLVVGALAAVLLIMAFEFLPRSLPPKAFRKPRLIALTPWHPG
jgi:hypothetical protein